MVTQDVNGRTSIHFYNWQGANYKLVQKTASALAAGRRSGVGEHTWSCCPTRVSERWEALLILPAPGGLALIKHCLKRRPFIVPGHIWAVGGKGTWSVWSQWKAGPLPTHPIWLHVLVMLNGRSSFAKWTGGVLSDWVMNPFWVQNKLEGFICYK